MQALTSQVDAGSLEWTACPEAVWPYPGIECASLTVPLDYSAPGGRTIQIAYHASVPIVARTPPWREKVLDRRVKGTF